MPAAREASGSANETSRPSKRTVPSSGGKTPPQIRIRVDFPEPFSPTRACTSPSGTAKLTPCKARTPPKRLLTPPNSRIGVVIAALSKGERSDPPSPLPELRVVLIDVLGGDHVRARIDRDWANAVLDLLLHDHDRV